MAEYVKFDHNFMLTGKTAVINGGASGIGFDTACLFHEKGARVIIWDINPSADEIARSIAPPVEGYRVDVKDIASIENAADRSGDIDILCNLAAVAQSLPAEDMMPEMWKMHLDVNLTGLFYSSQIVGRKMIAAGKGGKIINVASQAALVALYGHIAYAASKAGVLSVTRSLAHEWGKYGINVNAVSPTVIDTPMSDLKTGWWSGERGKKHLEGIPCGRFGKPDEVSAALLFLASDGANMINGTNLVIDGGYTISGV